MKKLIGFIIIWVACLYPTGVYSQTESMKHVSTGDLSFAYHVIGNGSGTPLLMINGGPGIDHQYFHLSDVWDQFAPLRGVIFFDQFGTGQSGKIGPKDSLSINDQLDGIEAIRRNLQIDSLAVLGHSWGGYLATAYAVQHPDRVKALILLAPVPPRVSDLEYNFAPLFPDSLERGQDWRRDNPVHLQQDLRRHLAMSFYSPVIRDSVLSMLDYVPFNNHMNSIMWAKASANDLNKAASQLSIPVLVATGRFDANVAPRSSWNVHKMFSNSQFAVWDKSGHYPMIEQPKAFFRVIENFLKEK